MNFIDANKSQHCPENAGIFIIVDLVQIFFRLNLIVSTSL